MALWEPESGRRNLIGGPAIGILCWVVTAVLHQSGALGGFDLQLSDLRFRIRGERPASDRIAIVGIDDRTIGRYGTWPIERGQYAVLLDALASAGAKAIGVDLELPSDVDRDPKWDTVLATVSHMHPSIVHAIWFFPDSDPERTEERPTEAVAGALRRQAALGTGVQALEAADVGTPYPELAIAAHALGSITVPSGTIRQVPIVIRYNGELYPSLALRVFGTFHGRPQPPEVIPARRGFEVSWPGGPRLRIATDAAGATTIDYAGDVRSFPHTYSMIDVLNWKDPGDPELLDLGRFSQAFAGRAVLVGVTSQRAVTEDIGTTPFATATPGIYVHANALDNLFRGRFLETPPPIVYIAALGALSVALSTCFVILAVPVAALGVFLSLAAIGVANFFLFANAGLDVPLFPLLILPPLAYALAGSYRYVFLERRARRREEDFREGRLIQQELLPEALVGQKLGHYQVEEMIGSGSMGIVYLARDVRLSREVAIKVLPGRALADDHARRRFRREAVALSKFRHPRIAEIYEFGCQDGTDFIAMEYVPGAPLTEKIRKGPLPEGEAIPIAVQVAEALEEAHSRGIIHRDLKPGNIVLNSHDQVKLLDFGLARLTTAGEGSPTLSRSITKTGQVVGTLSYMAPEVLRGEPAGPRSDLYALGVILFEMTTGTRPFRYENVHELYTMILNQPPPTPRVVNARISIRCQEIILKSLEKEPTSRYPNARAFLTELHDLASGIRRDSGTIESRG